MAFWIHDGVVRGEIDYRVRAACREPAAFAVMNNP
jgi:hypothetical protein